VSDQPPPGAPPADGAADGLCCPKCRTVNYPGLMGFPRCHNCHEQLRQCRYCIHQTAGLCGLDAGSRAPLQSAEGLPWCDDFASRFARSESARRLTRPVVTTPRTIAALAAACVLTIWLFLLAFGEEHGLRIEARDDAVRVIDGRALAMFVIRGSVDELHAVRCAVDLAEAPGYSVEEVALPAALRLAGRAARRDLPVPSGRAMAVEVRLLAGQDSPVRSRLRVALVAADGEPLASAGTRLLCQRAGR